MGDSGRGRSLARFAGTANAPDGGLELWVLGPSGILLPL